MKSFRLLAILTAALAMSAWAADKQPGSLISSFTAAANLTPATVKITVNPLPTLVTEGTAQEIEYAISKTTATPTAGWKEKSSGATSVEFPDLTEDTQYYVFARSKANPGYNAGVALFASIKTDPKTAGSALNAFEEANLTATTVSITVATAPTTTTGQPVEYAISAGNTAPTAATAWKLITNTPFTGLASGTRYYIFARAQENESHAAGAILSASIKTEAKDAGATLAFTAADNLTATAVSITVTAPTASTAQTVEYAYVKSTSATAPAAPTAAADWKLITDTPFSGLEENTQYWVYARAQASETHRQGAAASDKITTAAKTAGVALTSFAKTNLDSTAVSITVTTAPTLTGGGTTQAVEYAIGAGTLTAPPATAKWRTTPLKFDSLASGTTYTIFARAKENDSCAAGTHLYVSTKTKAKTAGVTLTSFAKTNLDSTAVSITVTTAPTLTGGGTTQAVEYAYVKSTAATAPSYANASWFATTALTGLEENTQYWVFARAKENDSCAAGAALSVSTTTTAKAAGIAIDAAPAGLTATANSITVGTAATLTGGSTAQTVEYAASTSATVPATGWQDGTVLTGLTAGTTYYVFARAKANAAYRAGDARSASTKTVASGGGGCTGSCSGYPGTTPVLSQIETGNKTAHIANGLSLSVSSGAVVSIYSLKGSLVQSLSYASGEHTMSLNSLPKGMYVAKVSFRNRENTLSHSETIKITVK
jgi:hypothetical protein